MTGPFLPVAVTSRMISLAAGMIFSTALVVPAWATAVDYALFEKVLKTYVNGDGKVDYAGLKENIGPLDGFLREQVEEADISALSDNAQKAFWINAYNALTLRLIVGRYPLRYGGIRSINWGRPWSVKMKAAGKTLTLGDIEHEILRKWDPIDPRIHFAINCASIGCPKLPDASFDPARLDEQLDREARRFINDPEKVRLNREKNILYHSAIFDWFEEDFLAVAPALTDYILKYLNEKDKAYILEHRDAVELKALSYDWGLNEL